MAVIANITSTSYETGTGIGYTMSGLNGAGGDGGLALWRRETSDPVFARTFYTLMARPNKARNARHLEGRGVVPYTVNNTTTGRREPVSRAMFAGSWILPQDCPSWVHLDLLTLVADTASQLRDQMATGFAPT